MILQLPDVIPYTSVARSQGLTTFDETHFDMKSQLELGKRYAQALRTLLMDSP